MYVTLPDVWQVLCLLAESQFGSCVVFSRCRLTMIVHEHKNYTDGDTQKNDVSRHGNEVNRHANRQLLILELGQFQPLPFDAHASLCWAFKNRDWAESQQYGDLASLSNKNDGLRYNAKENSDEPRRNVRWARRLFDDDFVRFVVAYQRWLEEEQSSYQSRENTLKQDTCAAKKLEHRTPTSHNVSEAYCRLLRSYIELSRRERSSWRTSECLNVDEGVRSFAEGLSRHFPWGQ